MKRTVVLGLFSLVLIVAFAAALVVGILTVSMQSNASGGNLAPNIPESMGTGTVDTPLTRRQLQKKYEKYNTVTEENGKTAVTIFSDEQIDDFNARRNNGEWFWLSTEEMLFLIEDTIRLFETYDLVYIRGLDGILHKYYGLSFFSSKEYYASFGGFDLGVTDASFDLKKDVYETILERVVILNTLARRTPLYDVVYSDISTPLPEQKIEELYNAVNPFYEKKNASSFGAWAFHEEKLYYARYDATRFILDTLEFGTVVFPFPEQFPGVGYNKYDCQESPVVVLELYDDETQQMILRLRIDVENDPQAISQFEERFRHFCKAYTGASNLENITKYRGILYLNGFDTTLPAIRFCPVGNTDLFTFCDGEDPYEHDHLFFEGGHELLEYAASLLKEYLP